MIISTKTKISFKVPEEHNEVRKFIEDHDMQEWEYDICSLYVTFTKSKTVSIEVLKEEVKKK